MAFARTGVLLALSLLAAGCKREPEPAARGGGPGSPRGSAEPGGEPGAGAAATWYRAALRGPDGVEVPFFLGVPPANAPGHAVLKVGAHEIRVDATFDGKTLRVPLTVHQTAVEATAGPDGALTGAFTTSWRAWGASSIPLEARRVDAPATSALATVAAGAPIDLGQPRTFWQLAAAESGIAKLTIDQTAPGDFTGLLAIDNGNIIYLAGNGRGDTLALAGFDGTSGYRVQLALGPDRARGEGLLVGGHRLDWREELTATRGEDFALAMKPRATRPDVKVGVRGPPELVALQHGPLVLEIGGSWCSTCRNAAPFFAELYREYRPRGLDMVTLLYEFTGDRELDAKQAEAFRRSYGAVWPVIPVLGTVDDFAEIMPSGLADLDPAGFPITLFLTADRSLVAMHAGFPAADAPDEFRRVAAEFRANIETLLSGRGGGGGDSRGEPRGGPRGDR